MCKYGRLNGPLTFVGDLPADLEEPLVLVGGGAAGVQLIVDVLRVERLEVACERAAPTAQRHRFTVLAGYHTTSTHALNSTQPASADARLKHLNTHIYLTVH